MKTDERNDYSDIMDLPHHRSTKHAHMAVSDRAAQFSPFAALAGYEAAVKETARRTEERIELSEEAFHQLNEKLHMIRRERKACADVQITYFIQDGKKPGGSYATVAGTVEKIDEYEQVLVMEDKTRIPMAEIRSIEGAMFDRMEKAR